MRSLIFDQCPYCTGKLALNLDHEILRRLVEAQPQIVNARQQHDQQFVLFGEDGRAAAPCDHLIWMFATCLVAERLHSQQRYIDVSVCTYHARFDSDPTEIFFDVLDGDYDHVLPAYDVEGDGFDVVSRAPWYVSAEGWSVFALEPQLFVNAVQEIQASLALTNAATEESSS